MLAPACSLADSRMGRGFLNANEASATDSPPNAGICGSMMAAAGTLLAGHGGWLLDSVPPSSVSRQVL